MPPSGEAKKALRASLRTFRRDLASSLPHAAVHAAAKAPLGRLPVSGICAGYHPVGGELDPGPLMARLAGVGARLALPAVVTRDAPLQFRPWSPGQLLVPDELGLPAPAADVGPCRPDLVIVPLLAFDRCGGRLGQGGGYYDRTLARLKETGPVFVLGLAYSGQEVDCVPTEDTDQRLDAVLTERGFIGMDEG